MAVLQITFVVFIVCVLCLPLLTIAGSIVIGIILALVNFQRVFKEYMRTGSGDGVHYILAREWQLIYAVVTQQFMQAEINKEQWHDHATTTQYLAFTHLGPLKYPAWLIIAALHIAAGLHYLVAVSICLLFIVIYTPVLLIHSLVTVSGLIILMALDRLTNLYRRSHRRACYCPCCYLETYTPLFLCRACQIPHANLRPNLHGVLFHACSHCHKRLPTLDLLGRRHLGRCCPRCHSSFPTALGTAPTLHIALVGGVASGKTAFLLAGLSSLLGTKADSCASFIDPNQQQDFVSALQRLDTDEVLPKTANATLPPRTIILRLRPRHRLLYLYDPAGKDFTSSQYVLQHAYYKHTNGLLFIIDPFAIPAFYRRYRSATERLSPQPQRGAPDVERIYERLMQAFEAHVGLHPDQPYRQAVAIVVTRADQLRLVSNITLVTAHAPSRSQELRPEEAGERHQLVRHFLCQYELENTLRDLETHFTHIRYFACLGPTSTEALQWLMGR